MRWVPLRYFKEVFSHIEDVREAFGRESDLLAAVGRVPEWLMISGCVVDIETMEIVKVCQNIILCAFRNYKIEIGFFDKRNLWN